MQIKLPQLLLAAILAWPSVLLPIAATYATDPGGCFMVDEAGNTISLGSLCGYGASTHSSARPTRKVSADGNITHNGVVQAPIIRRAGLTPVIAVSFNDSQTYEMILDTGASGTLITRRMANELNLRHNGAITASIADGSRVRFPTGRVKSIAVDTARVSDVDVAIAEDMDIGLLGHDFFGNYDISIGEDVVEFSQR